MERWRGKRELTVVVNYEGSTQNFFIIPIISHLDQIYKYIHLLKFVLNGRIFLWSPKQFYKGYEMMPFL